MPHQETLLGISALAISAVSLILFRRKKAVRPQSRTAHQAGSSQRAIAAPVALKGTQQGGLFLLPSDYPKVRRDDSVVEIFHGNAVKDPYRWLEDPDSKETQAFVEAQNKVSSSVLRRCETRDKFHGLMQQLYDYPRYGCPHKRGGRYYFTFNTGLLDQNVLYTQKKLEAEEPQILLDPNKLSKDGTVALMGTYYSEDGRFLSYNLGSGGSDWRTIKLKQIDLETGHTKDLDDSLEHVKFSSTAWTHDNLGFFYNRFAPPGRDGELGTETDSSLNQWLYYHRVGEPQSKDVFLLAEPEHPEWMLGANVTDDGRFLLVTVTSGCAPTNQLWYCDLGELGKDAESGALDFAAFDRSQKNHQALPITKLIDSFDASFEYIANEGTEFTFLTNLDAHTYRIVKTDISERSKPVKWHDVIPSHDKDLLQWAAALKGDALIVCYLRDVHSVLELRSLKTGEIRQEIPLPGIGCVSSFSSHRHDSEAFFSYTDFVDPGSIFRIDVAKDEIMPTLFKKAKLKGNVDTSAFKTEQVFATSKDGTKIPMFITAHKSVKLDQQNPTLLYGYGGFNISIEPHFSVSRLCFMLAYGGVYAVANLRGGGEYGVKWREAGSVLKKQNVFDDFQACAEHLIEDGYCSPSKLIIQGGSNGGLLVAACANQVFDVQRPDLFAAVLAQVGVMDMLRFHRFTIGHFWVTDYGDVNKEEDFNMLLSYSPLHNVRVPQADKPGQYPAMLLTTGSHDDRVVPLHSHKLISELQHALCHVPERSVQRNPLLIRVETRAGHGAGKPTAKIIEEASDMFAFAGKAVGAEWQHS